MPDYSQGKIYAIKSYQTDKVYIGSTTQRLSKRLNDHKDGYKRWKDGKHHYMTSYEIIEYEDCYIQLIKNVQCNNKEELTSVEYDVIHETENSVNKSTAKCKAPDYSNAKIYKIVSDKTDKVYIGSSVKPLNQRFNAHTYEYRQWNDGKHHYVTSFEILQYDDARIELIEEYECKTEEDLRIREGQIIKEYENRVNKMIAGRTNLQWREENKERLAQQRKEYAEANREHMIQKRKEYYQKNKERLLERGKEWAKNNADKVKQKNKEKYERNKHIYNKKIICECGVRYTCSNSDRHLNSDTHKHYMILKNNIPKGMIKCCCGKIIKTRRVKLHERSKTHNDFINNQSDI
jgi:hypothetical protein